LLNQFSVDFYKDQDSGKEYVRAATTINFWWGAWWETPQDAELDVSRTKNQVIIMELPTQDDDDSKLIRRGSVELGKKDEVRAISFPQRRDKFVLFYTHLILLFLFQSIQIITAVRFFDNISYVVTFEQTDPFYVLDLSDPENPTVLGELEIPGFSQFMHPIKDDNSVMITVGQDADDQGVVLGLQISLFDSANPVKPTLIDRYIIENNREQWSDSNVAWDERAFRYLNVGDVGRLIIPVTVSFNHWDSNSGKDFEGFMVFGVDLSKTEDLITSEFEVDHSRPYYNNYGVDGCYCYSSLPERSMVFEGELMTMKNQKIISTDLVTKKMQWNITLDDSLQCCYQY
jgi:hypothetical protein